MSSSSRLAAAAYVLTAAALAAPAVDAQAPAGTIAPNENLVAEGIPPIPAALAADVRRYTESRFAVFADWHPQRSEMLIATRFGNVPQIHVVRAPLGARTQLTFFDEPVFAATFEPEAGEYLLFEKDVGGNEFGQLYRYDLADGRVTLLTDGGRSQNGGAVWSTAGKQIAYTSTRRNGTDRDVYLMDPHEPKSDGMKLQVEGGGWSVLDWSPDDRRLLVSEVLSVNQSRLWVVDVDQGGKTEVTPPQTRDTVAYGGAEFSADGRGVYATSDAGGEFQRLVYLDLATHRVTPLATGIDWDIESFDLSEDGRTIAFVTNEAGASRLYLFDTGTRAVRPVMGVPVGVIGGVRWHRSGRYLAVTVASARSANDVYVLDAGSGQVTRWTESELGGLNPARLAEPALVRWKSFDGRELSGFLYRPPARFTGRRPVLVNIHGGPEYQSRPEYLEQFNYFLNELGVAYLAPNVRGSTGYGKTFVKLDNGLRRLDAVKDIGALLDWIRTQPDLDPARVMIVGGSYGGYMTLMSATTFDARICCAIDVVGISNFNTFLAHTEGYRRDLRRVEYGDERDPAMHAFFERTASVTNARKITKPLFVVQGANDPRVPRTEAEQMVAKVRQNGTPVWYLMAKDEGHGFDKKANIDFQFYAMVLFLRRYLLGGAATRPVP